jgi:hypothetical protein
VEGRKERNGGHRRDDQWTIEGSEEKRRGELKSKTTIITAKFIHIATFIYVFYFIYLTIYFQEKAFPRYKHQGRIFVAVQNKMNSTYKM